VYDVWGMSALIVSIAFALLGLTGIYLWFHFHKERKIGAILLGLNLAYSLGLIVASLEVMSHVLTMNHRNLLRVG
jgi:hypothetical protein